MGFVFSLLLFLFFDVIVGASAFADDHELCPIFCINGGSPFGGSFNFGYNASERTTYLFSLGGLPGLEMDQEIGGTDYTVDSSSAWMGAFIQHRPFDGAKWFRLAAGLGIGSIENELKDEAGNHLSQTTTRTQWVIPALVSVLSRSRLHLGCGHRMLFTSALRSV